MTNTTQKLLGAGVSSCRSLRWLTLLLAFGLWASLSARAQMTVGHITGTVTDTSGALIPGANITLTNTATGVQASTKSTSTGSYTFEQVEPGTYSLRVTAPGFATQVTNGITVHVQQTVAQSWKLAVGNVAQEVTVTAATPILQSRTRLWCRR